MIARGATDPTPVFVLGLQRSGTTWLANILANHPQVVAVQSADHFGVHESIFFSHFARAYGDLRQERDFRRFAEDFTNSDYYLLTGLEPEWLVRRRPFSYPEAFRCVMEEMARRRGGAPVWLEKSPSHTLLAPQLAEAFPDARFVGIIRQASAVVASQLRLAARVPVYHPAHLRAVIGRSIAHSVHQRSLERFVRDQRGRCMLTSYEALGADPGREISRVCYFLGLEFTAQMLDLPWDRNTSYRGGSNSPGSRDVLDRALVTTATAGLRLVPLSLLRARAARQQERAGIKWPPWCWRRRDAGIAT